MVKTLQHVIYWLFESRRLTYKTDRLESNITYENDMPNTMNHESNY